MSQDLVFCGQFFFCKRTFSLNPSSLTLLWSNINFLLHKWLSTFFGSRNIKKSKNSTLHLHSHESLISGTLKSNLISYFENLHATLKVSEILRHTWKTLAAHKCAVAHRLWISTYSTLKCSLIFPKIEVFSHLDLI